MDYLLDTNILIFMGYRPDRLKQEVVELLEDTENRLFFSAASVWEVVIKSSLNKPFDVDNPTLFRDGLFEAGLIEIPVKSEHTLVVADLPENRHHHNLHHFQKMSLRLTILSFYYFFYVL